MASPTFASRERITKNPFYVLGLRPDCARADVEREGQKLLGMLELGLQPAKNYQTPLGIEKRTPDLVRQAMAELREPERRLLHELWAVLPATPLASAAGDQQSSSSSSTGDVSVGSSEQTTAWPPWPEAWEVLGFGAKK
jgi:hypothetical protein